MACSSALAKPTLSPSGDAITGRLTSDGCEAKSFAALFACSPLRVASSSLRQVVPLRLTTTSTPSASTHDRSEEHTSELQSLMRISYAVFCLKTKTHKIP